MLQVLQGPEGGGVLPTQLPLLLLAPHMLPLHLALHLPLPLWLQQGQERCKALGCWAGRRRQGWRCVVGE